MSEENGNNILKGIGNDIFIKAEVGRSLAFINQLVEQSESAEMLKYVRVRLKQPYIKLQAKLKEMELSNADSKNVANY